MSGLLDRVPVFERGFRVFFLLAAAHAALALSVWIALLRGVPVSGALLSARDWHVHEMLFGFLPAVMAGFLLTAIPNWTGRPAVRGAALAAMAAVWLASRVVHVLPLPALPAALVAASFPLLLAAVAWREVVASRSWRQAPVCVMVSILALADAGFLAARVAGADDGGVFERLALASVALLMALIGGRVTPAFTGNWMKSHARGPAPAPFGRIDRAAMLVFLAAMCAWVAIPASPVTVAALGLACAATALRLSRWRALASRAEPLVLVLHLGYAWLVVWLALAACASAGLVATSMAVHALTAGAFGTMTLAIMTRASLGHAGKALHAGPATVLIYALVITGALARVVAPQLPLDYLHALEIAAVLWGGAYALFAITYAPLLLGLDRGTPGATATQ